MKRFLRYISFFVLPILVISICSEILLRKIPNDYLYKKNYLDKNSKSIKILFLGSSHAFYGIDPEYIKYTSFNAGYVSQTLDYDLAILEMYENKLDSLKYIVIPVDYSSLYEKLATSIESWRVKNYNIYWGIHTPGTIAENTEILSNKFGTSVNRLYSFYFKNNSPVTCSKLGWGTTYNSKKNKNLIISGKLAATRHFAKSNQYFNENVEILKSIITIAKARNIGVLLYTSPAYKTYVQNLDSNQLNNTIHVITEIVNSYHNAIYFDLLTDNAFTENDFYDADHLNEIGAKKLSIKIDSLLMTTERSTKVKQEFPERLASTEAK